MILKEMKFISTSVLVTLLLLFNFCRENSLVKAFFMEGIRFQVQTLASDSIESDVIESKNAWILAIEGNMVSGDQWQSEENKLRGVVNVAFVDLISDGEYMFEKGIIERDQPTPVAVVFPYGGVKTKKNKYERVNIVNEAKRLAFASLPEDYVSWVESKLHVETFVKNSYTSWPPRFPVVLTTAHEKYWHNLPGSRRYSEKLDLEDVYKQDLKRIFSNPESDKNKTDREEIKLSNIIEITYRNHKSMCDDFTRRFYVIAFLDKSQKVFEKNFHVFSEVHKIRHLQDKPLKFMWINASCHPEYGVTFGITSESLPALLVTKPQRRFFVAHTGKFNKNSIAEFIDKIFMGRLSFNPYSRFEDLEERLCGRSKLSTKVVSDEGKHEIKESTEKIMESEDVKKDELQNRVELKLQECSGDFSPIRLDETTELTDGVTKMNIGQLLDSIIPEDSKDEDTTAMF